MTTELRNRRYLTLFTVPCVAEEMRKARSVSKKFGSLRISVGMRSMYGLGARAGSKSIAIWNKRLQHL